MKALAVIRCRFCGSPNGGCDYRCLSLSLVTGPAPEIPEHLRGSRYGPRTPERWIAEHAHEWETGVADWPAAT